MYHINSHYRRFGMQLDVAAWAAAVIVSPHTKKKITAKKLLGRPFIIEDFEKDDKKRDIDEHLQRKHALDRQARALSKRSSNG